MKRDPRKFSTTPQDLERRFEAVFQNFYRLGEARKITTTDATDLESALTLLNDLKAAFNELVDLARD